PYPYCRPPLILQLATKFGWDEELPESFSLLLGKWHGARRQIQPVSRYLDMGLEVKIFCDASDFGCAAVCYVGSTIAYAKGHVWSEAEGKWTVPRKELQAMVMTLDILALWPADKLVSIYSDSEINLHRLVNGQCEKLPPPERRRVCKVSEAFERHNLKLFYVPSIDNKADIPTRPQQAIGKLNSWYTLGLVPSAREFVFKKASGALLPSTCMAAQSSDGSDGTPSMEEFKTLQRQDARWGFLIDYLRNKDTN
ncbi:hypothetical protein FOL46_003950, partial [Perkinsus olseni]